MVISARIHYACLAMLELAMRNDDGRPVAIREITDRHGIPGPFLTQILRTLRSAGWVQSVRGSQGGYRMAVDPSTITLMDIVEAVGCQEAGCNASGKASPADELLNESWQEAAAASRAVLSRVKLSELVERTRHGDATMFYI